MKKSMFWIMIATIAIIAFIAWGTITSNVEQAPYTIVESHDSIEIRQYAPIIVAQVEISGERQEAINQGFKILANYIFGENTASEKVAMTAPVIQEKSMKIAMTAPVTQRAESNHWKINFVMPSTYTIEKLPRPKNALIQLKNISDKKFAVIRFSGTANEESLQKHTGALKDFIKQHNLKSDLSPTYAFFNPPWTLPPLRRNEIMMELF
jgi:hypothetical protein